MVIKSPFKDYYDFVANQYGGGDPRLVYARNLISEEYVEINQNQLYDLSRYYGYRLVGERQLDYSYLIIAGKAYLLARPTISQPPFYKNYLDGFKVQKVDSTNTLLPRWMSYNYNLVFEREYPFLVELCRKVKAPVFVITQIEYLKDRRSGVSIHGRCPILNRIGVPALIDPYQMYQELSMFMGNKMKDTPDTQPPVELDNKQKIIKAGFDLRQSFRHRV